jgi:GT2 family glycosyltransferase
VRERPTLAQVREVCQPPSVMGRRNAEHWTGELYMRRLSPYVTRELVRTSVTANGVTWMFVLTGWAAALSLLLPGLLGVVLAVLLAQAQMLLDCVDGEVARWRRTSSPMGVFLDKVGHYSTEALIAVALGLRADGVTLGGWGGETSWSSTGGWTTLGALLAVLIVLNKALNDMVHVARAHAGLDRLADTATANAPRPGLVAAARRAARFVPFHRLYHSIELTLLARCGRPAARHPAPGRGARARLRAVGGRPHRRDPRVEPPAVMSTPTFGVVVLTQGTRPQQLGAAVASVLRQRDVEVDVVCVQDGIAADRAHEVRPLGLPDGVRHQALSANVGIPAARNAGVDLVRGDHLLFLDDDVELEGDTFLRDVAHLLTERPSVGLVQPRPVDPVTRRTMRRWVPRWRGRDPERPGAVFSLWEGATVVPRDVFEAAGRWPASFFYAHEGIELAWRVWDQGREAWYAADLLVLHPDVEPSARHLRYYELSARNRVWLARRNLGPVWGALYTRVWQRQELRRAPDDDARAALRRGWAEGRSTKGEPWPARPLRRSTPWRMTLRGRPPVF